jgi:hypothetical protein
MLFKALETGLRPLHTLALCCALMSAGCGGGSEAEAGSPASSGGSGDAGTGSHTVSYLVTGSAASAMLTYANAQGGTEQVTVALPWSVNYNMSQGDFLYVSAQNQEAAGDVTTTIQVDGNTFKTSTSSGAYVIATASGSCC